ncbi:O-antigen ligase family protein [Mucilaginibacter sp. L196]|uniref:O-antigen ligase family protein n=1 Tax=Mucilaginibacter sp. L196 TaxID=1641870 RepID=UPI00131C0B49|nr:O-antigen ligase family protein [Mucilaginibacter sp. L196]
MENTKPIPHYKSNKRFSQTFKRVFFVEKLYNTTGFILLSALAILIAVGTAYAGIVFGVLLIMGIVALPLLYAIIAYPKFGIIVLLIMSYTLFVLTQFGLDGPIGTLMDGLQVLLVLGMFIQMKKDKNWAIFKSPITWVSLLWLGYNLIELLNPNAGSNMAWLYTVRPVAITTLTYFVFMYNINSVKYIRLILKIWLFLTCIGAAYAFKQEYIGFNAHEQSYLAMPGIADLLLINGHWRKFSIFSDPVAFAYNMVMPSIFCICMLTLEIKRWKKIVLGCLIGFFLDAMLFSGTRGANVLIPAALGLFVVLKFNRRILIATILAAIFLAFLIMVPTSNPNLYRFQTAFKPSNDDSYNLRKRNQKRIQPYIVSHIMGGGLGSTGEWGERFTPESYLAHFPPDSGYIRVAVEDGWAGLLIFCAFMFVIMKTGINNYYLIEDKELKTYCLAMTLIIFAYNLANFPQEALVQFPSSILFYLEAALINITLRLDIAQRAERDRLMMAPNII